MLEENKNLKNQIKDISSSSTLQGNSLADVNSKAISFCLSYTKTNKLISALYMVTDIMDKEEPIRNKLRNLGTNIITDINSFNKGQEIFNQINNRVSEILSFIEIAFSVGIISEMNSSILIKEFLELRKSIIEAIPKKEDNWLQEFMNNSEGGFDPYPASPLPMGRSKEGVFGHRENPIGQGTRIGVQKGGTLLHALSRVQGQVLSNRISNLKTNKIQIERNFTGSLGQEKHDSHTNEILKNKRREEIILAIKDKIKDKVNFDGATISDIKSIGHGVLTLCGEKTLQRELVSMVSDGVLKKTGEKRWSKYSLK